ncbi:MAG: tetratricopeptide repeat protein [Phycisphaerae bacterium]
MTRLFKNHSQAVLATAIFLAIVGFYALAAVRFPMLYIWATYEDLYGEWVQFWSLIIAMALSARLVVTRWRYRWFFLLLALSCFYVAMEEISWGQRVFGFSSPIYFKANNLQGETNLHNFLAGPYGTTLKAALSYGLATALAIYGLILPALVRWRFRLALWADARGVAAPPLYLWPFFGTAAYLECTPFRFNEAEIAEILVGMALALTAVHYWFVRSRFLRDEGLPSGSDGLSPVPARPWGPGLTVRIALATLAVVLLSVATTTAVYASPAKKAKIDRRIENGIEKFAGRYARFEQWNTAISLYQRVHELKPERVSILRRLAECASSMGDQVQFDRYIHEALDHDLRRYADNPNRAGVNRSLTRTYRLIGDDKNAAAHLQNALQIGLRRVKKHPNSAGSAYSLGKTYLLLNQPALAVMHLSRAAKLDPTSKKYRKALFSARKSLQ